MDFLVFSVKGLFGFIERVYQKGEDIVRHEVKVNRKVSLTEFDSLLDGGLVAFGGAQAFYALEKRIEALTNAVKFGNLKILESSKRSNAVFDWVIQHFCDGEVSDS